MAGQIPELNEKLLKAISRNDLGEVQRFVAEGASPDASNTSGLSAIDIAVDNGFYDIAHFLIAIQKENPQAKRDTSNKQFFNLPPPSIIDKVSNFFKFESSGVSMPKNVSKLSVPKKTSIESVSGPGLNLFTKLTDVILDFLPDGSSDVPQSFRSAKQLGSLDSIGTGDEKVLYPVIDFTISTEDPYKIEKIVQTKVPPLETRLDKPSISYVAKSKLASVPKLHKAVPRNLKKSDLVFGGRGRLGDLFKATDVNAESCIRKSAWKSFFCIESFNWSTEIQEVLGTFGGLVGNGHSIVHYLNGKSVQFHGLFSSHSFGTIANLLISDLGAPTEVPKVMTSMLAAAEVPNRVFRWVANAIDDRPPLILEIREIDDLRWSLPPDRLNGVIRMYWEGEPSVFKILTAADLLLLQIRKGSQQKSLPVQKP